MGLTTIDAGRESRCIYNKVQRSNLITQTVQSAKRYNLQDINKHARGASENRGLTPLLNGSQGYTLRIKQTQNIDGQPKVHNSPSPAGHFAMPSPSWRRRMTDPSVNTFGEFWTGKLNGAKTPGRDAPVGSVPPRAP